MSKQYLVVVMDARGRSLRRVRVSRRLVKGLLWGCSLALLTLIGISSRGALLRGTAVQSLEIIRENKELRSLLHLLQHRLPDAQDVSRKARLRFTQVWAKSRLGRDPNMLGIGPVEVGPALDHGSTPTTTDRSSRILSLESVELPLEIDRLVEDGQRLGRSLSELVEYFHDAERLLDNTPSINPAPTPWLTSTFGKRRDPMTGMLMVHKGIDIGGALGDEIMSPADGVVIYAGYRGGYGRTVVLDHGYGLQTHFAHLSKFRVQVGDSVKRGMIIAEMGSTGKSTGPHLHYEVRRMGQPLNPLPFVWNQNRWPAR